MANKRLLNLLKQGAQVWNAWKSDKTSRKQLNLSRSLLNRVDLSDFDLKGVNLSGANLSGTILNRANLSIADITRPRSVQQEAQAIIPNFKIPFVRILQEGERPWSMSVDLDIFDWVLRPIRYPNKRSLIDKLGKMINLAEIKHNELVKKKALNTARSVSIEDI